MAFTGSRFDIDLSSDDEHASTEQRQQEPQLERPRDILSPGGVRDVKERSPSSTTKPPTAPTLTGSSSGFPAHKKRTRVSAFKQQRARPNPEGKAATPLHPPTAADGSSQTNFEELERQRIDEENKKRLADMTEEEIARERQELLDGLSPSLLERLLKRANLDDGRGDTGVEMGINHNRDAEPTTREPPERRTPPPVRGSPTSKPTPADPDADPVYPPPDLIAASATQLPPPPKIHFPTPPTPPVLDPSSPTFLATLHQKYFPSLPADPSKLAWMAPLPAPDSPLDLSSPYSPSQSSVPPSALRFDFNGRLLPPRTARSIPVTKGLHHHGDAPEAAGYTIPELAQLARSAFPAQKCLAFQTLGRMLYRLGKGEFGNEEGEMAKGLWRCVKEGRVLEGLQEAGEKERHLSAKSYAIEAMWNWQQGGGQLWKAG